MQIKHRYLDYCCVTCADMQSFLTEAVAQGAVIFNVRLTDDIVASFSSLPKHRKSIQKLAEKYSASIDIRSGYNLQRMLSFGRKRIVLLAGLFLLLLMSIILPQRILFIEVKGNSKIPDNLILEKAANCGVDFWALRRDVRSEKIKNALLSAIPELQWAGINTKGCTAIISVTERSDNQEKEPDEGICSIVAARDGIVKSCTVISGNPLCKPGQAVKEGQMLVSGYVDTGLTIRAVNAKAEIVGQTTRTLHVVSIADTVTRGRLINTDTRYSLIVGKKLINLFKDSRILDSTCVKINKIYPLTLPGGLQLPVSLLCQQVFYYESEEDVASASGKSDWICEYASSYLSDTMIAGTILQSDVDVQVGDDAIYFTGNYFCEEIIGKTRKEENLNEHAKDS